jgi:hypothetical protein
MPAYTECRSVPALGGDSFFDFYIHRIVGGLGPVSTSR